MMESFDNAFSIIFRCFIVVLIFSFIGHIIIGLIELASLREYLNSKIIDVFVFLLSVILTYYFVKFCKPYFDNIYKGE